MAYLLRNEIYPMTPYTVVPLGDILPRTMISGLSEKHPYKDAIMGQKAPFESL